MTKTYLLAAAAVAAMVAAGGAQAASISARAGAVAVTPSSPYRLAAELNYINGVTSTASQFDTIITFNQALQAGTYTVNLSYTGATLNAALGTTAVSVPTALTTTAEVGFESVNDTDAGTAGIQNGSTLTLTGGGTVGASSATYTLQIPAGAEVTAIYIAPALKVTGNVSATASVTNQVTGQPVDPSVIQSLITTNTTGFAARTSAVLTGTAGTDTRIAEGAGAPFFTTLANDGLLGQVNVAAASALGNINAVTGATAQSQIAYKDLNGTTVALSDITGGSLTFQGSLTGLTLATNQGTLNGNVVTLGSNPGTATTFTVTPVGGASAPQLVPSTYGVQGSFTLGSAFASSVALPAVGSSLESIETDGLAYVVPWVASGSLAATNGSTTFIRVANVGGSAAQGGRVYGQIYNPTTGVAQTGFALLGTLTASGLSAGDVVISSASLEAAFGNFGRADFRLVVTSTDAAVNVNPAASNVVVTRLIQSANGGLTEVNVLAGAATGQAPVTGAVNY